MVTILYNGLCSAVPLVPLESVLRGICGCVSNIPNVPSVQFSAIQVTDFKQQFEEYTKAEVSANVVVCCLWAVSMK